MDTDNPSARRFTLGAIDLDGTLLGPDLTISAANHAAVAGLQRHGAEVVLASGRHFHSVLPYARRLPGVRWIVSSQGGEVATVDRRVVLRQDFLHPSSVRDVFAVADALGLPFMAYTEDVIRSDAPAMRDFYAGLSGCVPVISARADLLTRRLHKVVLIGEPARIDRLADEPMVTGLGLQVVRTHERLFEVLPPGVTKASGLAALAAHLGLDRRQAVVFGDADNDLPMFAWAGTSVAMPHGRPSARAAASRIAPPGETSEALARAISEVLMAG